MELRPEEISRIIRSQIKHYETKINQSETGTVTLIGDGIARAAGLDGCMAGELLEFPGGSVRHGAESGGRAPCPSSCSARIERHPRGRPPSSARAASLSVPGGRSAASAASSNALGQPIDGKGPIDATAAPPRSKPLRPGIIERKSVSASRCRPASRPSTRMIPIGRGQRELIIGDRQTGKTAIATDTILNQKGKDVHLHLRRHRPEAASTVAQLVDMLDARAARWTIPSSSPRRRRELAPLQYIAPYSGCTMGGILHATRARTCSSSTTT